MSQWTGAAFLKAQEHPLEQTEAGESFHVPSRHPCELRLSKPLLNY